MTDPLFALALAVIVAAIYLLVLRLVDLNEKEPMWALALVLLLGAVFAMLAAALVGPSFRTFSLFGSALTATVAKFIAIALAVAALEGVSRLRGWSEFNGAVDGMIYGAAAGLGFATGDAFVRELALTASVAQISGEAGSFSLLWTTLLTGLSEGLFGALIGAAFGAALQARSAGAVVILPFVGLVVAFLVQLGYEAFAQANSLSGTQAVIRSWIALAIPVIAIIVLMVVSLRRERQAIAAELADEAAAGVVTEEELARLKSPGARRRDYMKRVMSGDIDGWLALRALHNRQVQLALTERRARGVEDAVRKHEIDAEAQNLRNSILVMKERLAAQGPAGERSAA